MSARWAQFLGQMARFGVVGAILNLLLYGIYLAATGLGAPPMAAMTGVYALGVAQTFVFQKRWVFAGKTSRPTFWRYALAYAGGYALNWVLLAVFASALGLPHQAVEAAALLAVAGYLFVTLRLWVFAPEADAKIGRA